MGGGGNNNGVYPMRAELNQDSDRFTNREAYTSQQRATWEKSFDSDPNWRLLKGYGNSWTYAPSEPESEQYKQGKQAMDDVTNRVLDMVHPSSGTYNPKAIPMRGGGHGGTGDWLEQLHFDPSRSRDTDLAEALLRLGVYS